MNTSAQTTEQKPTKSTSTRKIIFWTAFIFVALVIISLCIGSLSGQQAVAVPAKPDTQIVVDAKNASTTKSADEAATSEQEGFIDVTSDQIVGDYDDNEVKADQKYQYNFVQVTGVVDLIAKGNDGTPYVTLKPHNRYALIGDAFDCIFNGSEDSHLASLKTGQKVTLVGVVDGRHNDYVVAERCFIMP